MIKVQYTAICDDCGYPQRVEPVKDSPEPFVDVETQLKNDGWEVVNFYSEDLNGHFCPDCALK